MARLKPLTESLQRRLGSAQLAFVRSWVEGIDLAFAWNRYLYVDGAADGRRARGELQRLRDELRAAARAHGRADIATLLGRDPATIAEPHPAAGPTLDEFRLLQPPDFYSEAELLTQYRVVLGPAARAGGGPSRRRQRLRVRLLEALQWLATRFVREPQAGDPVMAWLDERVSARLATAGIVRLEDLLARIGRQGPRWHRGIARLGVKGAARIVRWLQAHEATLGALPRLASRAAQTQLCPALALAAPDPWVVAEPSLTLLSPRPLLQPTHSPRLQLHPPSNVATEGIIVPLERFDSPRHLDGSLGNNRADTARCKLMAANDQQALEAWLRLRVEGSHTRRAYRKEAERFLLWAVVGRGKALSSLDGDDCVTYRDFLAAPGLAWTGPRHAERWSSAWRPFEGPLAPRSAATAITVVRTLCEWLVRRRYLDTNPWDDVPQRPDAPAMPQLRALSQRQWQSLQSWLDAQPRCPAHCRLRLLLSVAYSTGMRLAELAAARVEWLRHEPLDDGTLAWSLMVLGKRAKWREVPLPGTTVETLRENFSSRGLNPDLLSNPLQTPLIGQLPGRFLRDSGESPGLSPARIYEVLVDAFKCCADDLENTDPPGAERIRRATTHWLRHTHGSHAAARGVPQEVLQANLGHQSLATTSIYIQAEKGRRQREIERAFGAGSGTVDGVTDNAAGR